MPSPLRTPISFLVCMTLMSGCARNMASNVYSDSATPGKVLAGTILSARPVTIKAHDKLQDNTLGGLTGAAAGGIAADKGIGNGNGSLAAGVGGAIIGALAGAYLQDALSTSDGVEYLVKLDAKYAQEGTYHSKKLNIKTTQSNEDDLKSSINVDSKTDIISVVQAGDTALREGSHVYVVYNDDRPRLVADKSGK